jgi:hypothetical protein
MSPGLYARSRYGPGYLQHAQSWRYEGLETAYANYDSGRWKNVCADPGRHDCLEKYPADGNLMFHPKNIEKWREEEK